MHPNRLVVVFNPSISDSIPNPRPLDYPDTTNLLYDSSRYKERNNHHSFHTKRKTSMT